MLPLGHMGIGRRLVAPWTRDVPVWAVLVGTLVPDLIDKPVYYTLCWLTGRQGLALGLISSTRTFGHTLLLTLLVLALGRWRKFPVLVALGFGMLSHLVLDTIDDGMTTLLGPGYDTGPIPGIAAVLWPLLGVQFPIAMSPTLAVYAHRSLSPVNIAGEIAGGILLFLDWRAFRRRHRPVSASTTG
jgi:hypothetical protein